MAWMDFARLEAGVEAESEASCGSDCVAGEETTEVDHIEPVVEVIAVGLKASVDFIAFVDIHTQRGLDGQGGIDAPAVEVEPVDYSGAVLSKSVCLIATVFEG